MESFFLGHFVHPQSVHKFALKIQATFFYLIRYSFQFGSLPYFFTSLVYSSQIILYPASAYAFGYFSGIF